MLLQFEGRLDTAFIKFMILKDTSASYVKGMTFPIWVRRPQTCAEVQPPSNENDYPLLSKALVVDLKLRGAIATLLQAIACGAGMLVVGMIKSAAKQL